MTILAPSSWDAVPSPEHLEVDVLSLEPDPILDFAGRAAARGSVPCDQPLAREGLDAKALPVAKSAGPASKLVMKSEPSTASS